MAVAGQNTRRPPAPQENYYQSKPILVIISIKLYTCQSFRQNYFSREIEWAVFTEVPENIHATPTEGIGFSQGKGGSICIIFNWGGGLGVHHTEIFPEGSRDS